MPEILTVSVVPPRAIRLAVVDVAVSPIAMLFAAVALDSGPKAILFVPVEP